MKIKKECERRSLRGCAGCPALHSLCDKEKVSSKRKTFNNKMSLEMAEESEAAFKQDFYQGGN